MNRSINKSIMKNTAILVFWLAVWEILALAADNSLLVPSPGETAGALVQVFQERDLYLAAGHSLGRILAGLLSAFFAGTVFAVISYMQKTVEELLNPLLLCVKAVPVASYVILLLVWKGSGMLSVGISFLVALPVVYTNLLEALKKTDKNMLEMAEVFGIRSWNRIWYIYRPGLKPAVLSSVKLACATAVKAGVAAEIIGLPDNSFGEKLYLSKIYLSMDQLFAWTIVIVLSALLLEKIVLLLVKMLLDMPVPVMENTVPPKNKEHLPETLGTIYLENVSKMFDNKIVFQNVSLHIPAGETVGIMAPSGSGKTTLFRILSGLEQADGGTVSVCGRVSAVFQDSLLCGDADVITNMKLVSSGSKSIRKIAQRLLNDADLYKKCRFYSGGMKRRAAIGRALAADYDILLLDEPFVSLDDETRRRTAAFVKEQTEGKTVLLFTHNEEDIKLLGGICYESKEYVPGR